MNADSQSSEKASTPSRLRKWVTEPVVRRVVIVALVGLVLLNFGELRRRAGFWVTGTVESRGATFYLDPADKCMTRYMIEDGEWEPEETQLLLSHLKPGDTVVDVGANFGWYTVLASRAVGDEGLVIAFEPEPNNFALLKRNVEENGCRNVRLEQKALSNEPGSITLFLNDANKGMHSTLKFKGSETSIDVEALRLDDYLSSSSRRIDLVKIDVEGAEGMVLEGMTKTIKANPSMNLLVEFAPKRLVANGYDPEHLLVDLAKEGFKIYQVDDPRADRQVAGATEILSRLDREELPHVNLLITGAPTFPTFP